MPKVHLRPIDKFRETMKHNYMAVKGGRTYEELGTVIGRAKQAALNRANDPLSLTLGELFLLCQHEHISPSEFVGGELRLKGVVKNEE